MSCFFQDIGAVFRDAMKRTETEQTYFLLMFSTVNRKLTMSFENSMENSKQL